MSKPVNLTEIASEMRDIAKRVLKHDTIVSTSDFSNVLELLADGFESIDGEINRINNEKAEKEWVENELNNKANFVR